MAVDAARFVADVRRNAHVRAILDRWERLALPDGWLVAGCLFQTVWNLQAGRAPEAGIKDYDLFWFDGADLGAPAEARVQARVAAELADLGIAVEACNQARVHLWYERHFGRPCGRLRSVREGIDRFLVPATCVGVRPDGAGGCEVYAPNGLDLLYAGRLQPNPLTDHRELYLAKARSYRARWPWLQVEGDAAPAALTRRGTS
jgi:hypothetical protein